MKLIQLLLILFFTSCINHSNIDDVVVVKTSKFKSEIQFAQGFDIDDSNADFSLIKINSNHSKYNFSDSIYIIHSNEFDGANKKVLTKKLNNLAIQSTTYLSYLSVLNKLSLVRGVSGLQYVNSVTLNKKINKSSVNEIGNNGSIQMESLLKVDPDLFLIYPFELDNKDKYNSKGIETLLISEYLESTPLARLEWLKLFGMILDENELANAYFDAVTLNYNAQKIAVDSTKTMFFNLPFKENWNMPNSNSITANLLRDAGFDYVFSDTINDNAIRSKEIVWDKAMNCEYWIIITSRPANYTLEDLKNEESIYSEFSSVKNNKVIFCNTSTTDYFTMGVVEPDVMLRDLVHCMDSSYNSKYFRLLK